MLLIWIQLGSSDTWLRCQLNDPDSSLDKLGVQGRKVQQDGDLEVSKRNIT